MSVDDTIGHDSISSHTQSFSRSTARLTLSNLPTEASPNAVTHRSPRHERFGDKAFEIEEEEPPAKYVKKGDHVDVLSRGPSYTQFKIPYQIVCINRYRNAKRRYEEQILHEINQNIDFQSTAAEACYFVRVMALTSFWPPLHNREELRYTSGNFYKLSPKESRRFMTIMCTDIL